MAGSRTQPTPPQCLVSMKDIVFAVLGRREVAEASVLPTSTGPSSHLVVVLYDSKDAGHKPAV